MSGLRNLISGSTRYLSSVFVAVMLAPVVPDMAVELFGAPEPLWRDPSLRAAALLLVLVVCIATYRFRVGLARRRARRSGYRLAGIQQRDVLVLPIGHRSTYQARKARIGAMSVVNWLVDAAAPGLVLGVASPQISGELLADLHSQLARDGIEFEHVTLRDVGNPETAVADAERLVIGELEARGLLTASCYVDTTGGNVVMSIAMLRVAALLGVQCTYVSSRYENNQPVPGTQIGNGFDPRNLLAVGN